MSLRPRTCFGGYNLIGLPRLRAEALQRAGTSLCSSQWLLAINEIYGPSLKIEWSNQKSILIENSSPIKWKWLVTFLEKYYGNQLEKKRKSFHFHKKALVTSDQFTSNWVSSCINSFLARNLLYSYSMRGFLINKNLCFYYWLRKRIGKDRALKLINKIEKIILVFGRKTIPYRNRDEILTEEQEWILGGHDQQK